MLTESKESKSYCIEDLKNKIYEIIKQTNDPNSPTFFVKYGLLYGWNISGCVIFIFSFVDIPLYIKLIFYGIFFIFGVLLGLYIGKKKSVNIIENLTQINSIKKENEFYVSQQQKLSKELFLLKQKINNLQLENKDNKPINNSICSIDIFTTQIMENFNEKKTIDDAVAIDLAPSRESELPGFHKSRESVSENNNNNNTQTKNKDGYMYSSL